MIFCCDPEPSPKFDGSGIDLGIPDSTLYFFGVVGIIILLLCCCMCIEDIYYNRNHR